MNHPAIARRLLILLPTLALALSLATVAVAQENSASGKDGAKDGSATPTPRTLFREGSALLDAAGTMHRSKVHGNWSFTTTDPANPVAEDPTGHEFILLPCVLLGEMQQIHDANPEDEPVVFLLTGSIYTYRGYNYLLPTFAPRLIGHVTQATDETQDNDADTSNDAGSDDDAAGDDDDDSIDAIKQRLREAAGNITANTSDTRGTNVPRSVIGRTPPLDADRLVREGTNFVNRRGKLTRDSTGAWVYVFDADAQGLSDPPMTVIPCAMLQEMEKLAIRNGNSTPMLVTGIVFAHGERNYLLPTIYRVPRERSGIR